MRDVDNLNSGVHFFANNLEMCKEHQSKNFKLWCGKILHTSAFDCFLGTGTGQ